MTIDLSSLENEKSVLFAIPLTPLQGQRFQPTGFPGLGAATFQTPEGTCLLVESAQSMANRLEMTVWDDGAQDVNKEVQGISHVRITRQGKFLTDTILESHRLNSPYLLEGSDKTFFDNIKNELGVMDKGPIDRKKLAEVLLKYDIGSLLHGVFLAKKELAGGRLRVARALSAFIEAEGVRVAPSGGVKNDHVNPSGVTKSGFGNVPFARDEFTAEKITLYANIDLAQIRGYGLGGEVERLLVLLALYKLRSLVNGTLRLRTACYLRVGEGKILASTPSSFELPMLESTVNDLKEAIEKVKEKMVVEEAVFDDELKTSKEEKENSNEDSKRNENDDVEE